MFSVMGLGMQTEQSCCGAFTVAVGIIGLMTAKEGQTDVSNMEGYQMIAELTEFMLGFYGTLHCVELQKLEIVGVENPCHAIVLLGNWHKFSQNRELREFLLSTGDSVLVEASPYDAIWGIRLAASSPEAQDPMKWRGQNLLGFALMEVRDELRRVTQNEMLCDWSMVWQQ